MADATIEVLKAQLRLLRLPTMGREFDKLAQLAQKEFVLAPFSARFPVKSSEKCSETTPKVNVVKI
jgi:hypothetical protein